MEIKANFPTDLVIVMQESTAKKARRIVIGRTLGGRATFKALLDCFKLHLSAPFNSVSLLTRGYFEVLFKNEEGAKATKRLGAVEWSGMGLSFSHYIPNFDSSSHGAEAQLTHAIKVQFPDLHEQFRNTRALTIMASKIGEVLEIEAVDSYIKRPVGPMITIELRDISKLPGYIRIPSMAEGAEPSDTVAQIILYSSLPNQCRKCRRFDHHARACTINRSKLWEGAPVYPPHKHQGTRRKGAKGGGIPQPIQVQASKQLQTQNARNQAQIETIQHQKEDNKHPDHPAHPNIASTSTILANAEASPRNRCLKATSRTSEADQDMADLTSPPGLNQVRPNTRVETPLAIAHPQAEQPNFGYRLATPHQIYLSAANANPFTALEALSPEAEGPKDAQGKLGETWTFQASKKQSSRIVSPRKTLPQSPAPASIQDPTPGSGRKRMRSEVHSCFFTSLGIPVPPGQEHARSIVWPVLSRERNN
jgi:hypothetical protein